MLPVVLVGAGIAVAVSLVDKWNRSNDVRHGFAREKAIARYLTRRGAAVEVSPGSRGPADVTARWSTTTWKIQVKASRRGKAKPTRPNERERLQAAASGASQRAVLAYSNAGRTTYHCAVTGERIYPPGPESGSAGTRKRRARPARR